MPNEKQIVRFDGGRAEMAVDSREFNYLDKSDAKGFRKAIERIAQERYAGKAPVTVKTKDGEEVVINWQGVKHNLNNGQRTWQNALVSLHLEELLSNAVFVSSEPNRYGKVEPSEARYYESFIDIDGNRYSAKITARTHKDGKRYYEHLLVNESQAALTESAEAPAQPQQGSQENTTTTNLTKQQAADIISQDADGKRLLKKDKVKVLGSIDEAPDNVQNQITLSDADGNIQGFFDPVTDTTYLVADALTADTIEGVLVHEVGVHAWWAKANSDKKAALEKRAMQLLNQGKYSNEKIKAFYAAVEQRMIDADVQGNAEEAAAYIVEEAINQASYALSDMEVNPNDKAQVAAAIKDSKANMFKLSDSRVIDWVAKNISQSLANFLSDFISSVRASMHSIGWLKTANLTGADLVAIAKRNMREVAQNDVGDNVGILAGDVAGNYAGVLASMASDKPTQAEIAQAQRDLDTQLAIADKLEAEYGYLPAPNGEKSNLNRLQWAQVRTPQFKEFYGDWEKNGKQLGVYRGSEESSDWRGVVGSSQTIATTDRGAIGGNSARGSGVAGFTDGNGEPVIFYHGTSDDFDSFDTNHANRKDKGWLGH